MSPKDVASVLTEGWDMRNVRVLKTMQDARNSHTVLAETGEKRVILQELLTTSLSEHIQKEMQRYFKHLRSKDFEGPMFIERENGSILLQKDERIFRAQEVLSGEVLIEDIPTLSQSQRAVSTLAHLHSATVDFVPVHTNAPMTFDHLREKNDQIESVIGDAKAGVRSSAQKLLDTYAEFSGIPIPELPHAIVHGDLNKKNFLFNEESVHIVDFDYFYSENRMADLAQFCCCEWATQENGLIDFDRVQLLIDAYHKQFLVSKEEAASIDIYMMIDLQRIWMWRLLWQIHEKQKRIHRKTLLEQRRMEDFLENRTKLQEFCDTL